MFCVTLMRFLFLNYLLGTALGPGPSPNHSPLQVIHWFDCPERNGIGRGVASTASFENNAIEKAIAHSTALFGPMPHSSCSTDRTAWEVLVLLTAAGPAGCCVQSVCALACPQVKNTTIGCLFALYTPWAYSLHVSFGGG